MHSLNNVDSTYRLVILKFGTALSLQISVFSVRAKAYKLLLIFFWFVHQQLFLNIINFTVYKEIFGH